MRLTPTYGFDDLLSTGIDKVPNFSHVMVEDDGNGQTRLYMKVSDVGLTPLSTISDFLANTTLYCRYEPTRSPNDPTNTDDVNSRYKIGHVWVNESTSDSFVLVDDSAGSAVWSKINDTNADTLDNLDSTQFVRSDIDDIVQGQLTFEQSIKIEKTSPSLMLNNLNAGSSNFSLVGRNQEFVIIADRDRNGMAEAPDPFDLNNISNKGYVYGDEIVTYNNLPAEAVSQLEKITEGSNTGWALLGRNPANYGNIGNNAVDISTSAVASTTKGATGNYSVAEGLNTISNGIASHAEGQGTEAGEDASHAEGTSTVALGFSSHAEGQESETSGTASHAEGYRTFTNGEYSHAEGNQTRADGHYSHAEGHSTNSSGDNSHAEGLNTISSGNNSHAQGQGTVAKNPNSFATGTFNVGTDANTIVEVGIGTDSSSKSNGLEIYTDGRVTVPELTTALINTNRSVATKEYVDGLVVTPIPSQLEKITEGGNTGWALLGRASSNYGDIGTNAVDLSTSLFSSSTKGATGLFSLAQGQDTEASGSSSHAEGRETIASGSSSHAEGYGTIAKNQGSHACGKYNVGTSTSTILEVGIGTGSGDKKNALEIYTDGRIFAPELSLAEVNTTKSLATKEYIDDIVNHEHNWTKPQYSSEYSYGTVGVNTTINLSLRNNFNITMSAGIILTINNGYNGQSGSIFVDTQNNALTLAGLKIDTNTIAITDRYVTISYYRHNASNIVASITQYN